MRRRHFLGGLAGAAAATSLVPAQSAQAAHTAAPRTAPRTAPHAAPARGAAGGWQEVAVPAAEPAARFHAIDAAGPGLAWAVGVQELQTRPGRPVAHTWDGTRWAPADLAHLDDLARLHAVAGTADQAWALGTSTGSGSGTDEEPLLHGWDGTTWQQEGFPGQGEAGTRLTGVAIGADGTVWASGRRGTQAGLLTRPAGGNWQWTPPIPGDEVPPPEGVHITPGGEVWVYGGVIARWDGEWTVIPRTPGIYSTVTGLLPQAPDDIWLTGYAYSPGGPIGKPPAITFQRWNGAEWAAVAAPFSIGMLNGITADDQGRPDLVPGWDYHDQSRAHYLRWDGTDWRSERGPETETTFLPHAHTRIPGPQGGHWSAGTTSFTTQPPAQLRIERHA